MRWRKGESQRPRAVRHGIAAAIFWLLPLLAFAGVLVPDMLQVVYEEEEEELVAREGTTLFRPARLSRVPLVVPRDYSAGMETLLLDVESLFRGTQFRGEEGRVVASMPSFPSAAGDALVIDELDAIVAGVVFKDALEVELIANNEDIWDPAIFDVIPQLFPIGDDFRFDDFPDPGIDLSDGVVVPEPGTGSLVALGLAAFAARRRRT